MRVVNFTWTARTVGLSLATVEGVLIKPTVEERKVSHPEPPPSERHKVVIIGSGFGGLTAAQKLKHADVDIKLIAKTTHHLFQPLLYQVATGILSEGEIAPPTRDGAAQQRNAAGAARRGHAHRPGEPDRRLALLATPTGRRTTA
jgi:hypothetical protein